MTAAEVVGGTMGDALAQFQGAARIRAAATESRLAEHWDIVGDSTAFTCSCGYPLGDGSGDLDGRHRAHVAEVLSA